jgi:uncharacterized protein (DUF58 family)
MPAFEFHVDELHRLRGLAFTARIPAMLGVEGSRRVRRAAEGLEFFDFRPYVPGDDPRHLDWNLYGRFRQLFVRVFESHRYLSIGVMVDTSQSMCFGQPVQKVALACQLASALSYVALSRGERLSLATFAGELGPILGPLHGMKDVPGVVEYLQTSDVGQATSLYESVKRFCSEMRSRGLLILLSDFLTKEGYEKSLRLALAFGRKLLVVQVLDALDLGWGLEGSVKIRDSETGQERYIYIDGPTLARYKRSVAGYCDSLADFCRAYGQYYVRSGTQDNYLETVCHTIRSAMVLQ